MRLLIRGLSARRDECTNNRTSQQELYARRETTGSVPTVAAMKELVPAWAQARNNVFEVGG